MRLVHPSRRREVASVLAVLVLGFAVALMASRSDADARPAARPATGTVIPNGYYGVEDPASGEYIVFQVKNRKVRKLEFQVQVTCRASDSPTPEQRFFSAGARAPQGRTIPANGKLVLGWTERAGGRLGEVEVELKFGSRDKARITVIVPEEEGPPAEAEEAKERCEGGGVLQFRRGPELSPLPGSE